MLDLINPIALTAYIDSGTGSLFLQAVLGGLLTGGYVIRTRWSQIRSWLSKRPDTSN